MPSDPQREAAATTPRLWMRLTRRCNNHCLFCHDAPAQNGDILPLDEIRRQLKKGRRQGYRRVVLSGGEATLHPDFLEIIASARRAGFDHIQTISNGRMFAYKDYLTAAIQAGLKEITFSMHGHNARLHDALTRSPGSFRQALAGLKNAVQSERLIVSMDIVINRLNIRHLKNMIVFFYRLGIREFDLLNIIPFGEAWTHRQKLMYDPSKTLRELRQALDLGEKLSVCLWTNRFPPSFLEGYEKLIQHPCKLHDETGGRRLTFENFVRHGERPDCYGPRCSYCFLKSFCADIMLLRRQKSLSSLPEPRCLSAPGKNIKEPTIFRLDHKAFRVKSFTEFFIRHRYFIKSLRCRSCVFNATCAGASCLTIREKGFKILRPIHQKSA